VSDRQEILAELKQGASVLSLAWAYDVDPKTIRAWRAGGGYGPLQPRPSRSCFDVHSLCCCARAP
jgi:hypothetical protein